jgi:hypothetical protein
LVDFSGNIIDAVLQTPLDDAGLALITVLFSKVPPTVIDGLLGHLIDSQTVTIESKWAVFELAASKLGNRQFRSLPHLIDFASQNLIPSGLNFAAKLLLSDSTAVLGLRVFGMGLGDSVVRELFRADSYVPRLVHFLSLVRMRVSEVCARTQSQEFENAITGVLFAVLARFEASHDRSAFAVPAASILRAVDRSVLESVFANEDRKSSLVAVFEPPKTR